MIFEGAAYCPHCGAARVRDPAVDAQARCPACPSALHRVDVGSTPILECESCDGVWVDADVFERLCADRDGQAAVLHRLPRPSSVGVKGPVRYRPCLRCGKMMNRVNFGRLSGAIVDVCKGHGTFLDAGELHQIVTFIHGGGLDRVRTLEKEELKAEARKVQQAQDKLARERTRHSGSRAQIGSGSDISGLIDLIDLMRGV
jgi:Zn-finger nucleic acid-binding protein